MTKSINNSQSPLENLRFRLVTHSRLVTHFRTIKKYKKKTFNIVNLVQSQQNFAKNKINEFHIRYAIFEEIFSLYISYLV